MQMSRDDARVTTRIAENGSHQKLCLQTEKKTEKQKNNKTIGELDTQHVVRLRLPKPRNYTKTYLDRLHGDLSTMFIQVFLQVQVAVLENKRQLLFFMYHVIQPVHFQIKPR